MFSKEQIILVTGASSGIGKSIALSCLAKGATVLACGRDSKRLEEARQESVAPERWISLQRDFLEDMQAIPEWVRQLSKDYGKLWALAHASGEGIMDSIQLYDLDLARRHFDLNFHVACLLAKGFCDRRVVLKGGALLFIASASAVYPEKGHLIYGAAKAALVAMAKSLSQEMSARGVRVHCLSPGIVDTPLEEKAEAFMGADYRTTQLAGYPFGFGKPSDVAEIASFLLSDKANWITGQNFVLDGGRY